MAEPGLVSPSVSHPLSPGLAQAQQLVTAGQRALACGHGQLAWALLRQWPAWALERDGADGHTRAAWRQLGLRWHARALQRSIDGAVWQAAEAVLPSGSISAAIDAARHDPAGIGATQLPAAAFLATHFEDTGRDITVAAIEPAALRAAVAAATGAQSLPLDSFAAQRLIDSARACATTAATAS